jgi:hypothetical protein
MPEVEWFVTPREKGPSAQTGLNLLGHSEGIYLTDNHRAALWCYLRETNASTRCHYLHIDAHYDCLPGAVADFRDIMDHVQGMSIADFMRLTARTGKPGLVRWDNYNPIWLELYAERLLRQVFVTHKMGLPPTTSCEELDAEDIADENFFKGEDQWIVNLDLDYFFDPKADPKKRAFKGELEQAIFTSIKKAQEAGRVLTTVVALSPECCGDWDNSLKVARECFSNWGRGLALLDGIEQV